MGQKSASVSVISYHSLRESLYIAARNLAAARRLILPARRRADSIRRTNLGRPNVQAPGFYQIYGGQVVRPAAG